MTVFESVVDWITEILQNPKNGFPSIGTLIDLEEIPDNVQFANAGLFASPNDSHTLIRGGRQKHTVFLSFYSRRSFREYATRLGNEVFFEKFRQAVHEKNLDRIMPQDGRGWLSISINGGIYPAQRAQDNSTGDYLVPLKLEYIS